MRGVRFIAVAVLAAGALAAGCGDDDDEDALSESEYVAQANEICSNGERELNQAAEEVFGGGGQPTDAEVQQFATDTVIPNIQDQIDQIGELTPPEDRADEFESFLDEAQAALDTVEADPSLFTGGEDPFAEVNVQADELGLTACAG